MYRCENCKTVVPANQKLNRVVVETREKSYPIFRNASRGRRKAVKEQVGHALGFEIAKELRVCASCAVELADKVSMTKLAVPATMAAVVEAVTSAPEAAEAPEAAAAAEA